MISNTELAICTHFIHTMYVHTLKQITYNSLRSTKAWPPEGSQLSPQNQQNNELLLQKSSVAVGKAFPAL